MLELKGEAGSLNSFLSIRALGVAEQKIGGFTGVCGATIVAHSACGEYMSQVLLCDCS